MIEDGKVYVFHLKFQPSKVIAISSSVNGSDIEIKDYKRFPSQRFQALKKGDYFVFKELNSEYENSQSKDVKVISIEDEIAKEGVKIKLYDNKDSDSQKWKVVKDGSGYIYFQSKLDSNYCLDAKNEKTIYLSKYNKDSDSQKFKFAFKEIYKFRVGVRGLFHLNRFTSMDITHCVFLLGSDLFEYGVQRDAMIGSIKRYSGKGFVYKDKDIDEIEKQFQHAEEIKTPNGYTRSKGVGRGEKEENGIDWDRIGEALHGTTWIQPDELEESIKKSGEWTNEKYDIFKHNCHDFVRECLKIVGCHETMIAKNLPVYRPCQKSGIWNLWNLWNLCNIQ